MRTVSDKSARFTESVIRGMTRLCEQHGGINLAQGFPDFAAPIELKEAAKRAIDDDYNQYAVTWGTREFRAAIAAKVERYNGIRCDPDTEITVTCGSTEAMIASLLAVVNPGDEIVVFEPFYENYGPDAVISGARPGVRDPAATALHLRSRRAARRVRRAHQGDHRQHATQPQRPRVHARRVGADRRRLPGVRLPGDHRRDLRAHHL